MKYPSKPRGIIGVSPLHPTSYKRRYMLDKFKDLYEQVLKLEEDKKTLASLAKDIEEKEAVLNDKIVNAFKSQGLDPQLDMFQPEPKEKYTVEDVERAINQQAIENAQPTQQVPTDLPSMCQALKATRHHMLHDQAHAAVEMGISASAISRFERGEPGVRPRGNTLRSIRNYIINFNPKYGN